MPKKKSAKVAPKFPKVTNAKPLTKTGLVENLHQHLEGQGHELKAKVVKDLVAHLPLLVAAQVKKHGAFTIPGVGKFVSRKKPAVKAKSKKVRNPATGEQVWQKPRPASTVVKMRVAKQLKDAVA